MSEHPWEAWQSDSGRPMDINGAALAEVIAMPSAPLVVTLGKGGETHTSHTVYMPKGRGKIHPFLAAILADRAVKQGIDTGIGLTQKSDEVVFHHRLGLGV